MWVTIPQKREIWSCALGKARHSTKQPNFIDPVILFVTEQESDLMSFVVWFGFESTSILLSFLKFLSDEATAMPVAVSKI